MDSDSYSRLSNGSIGSNVSLASSSANRSSTNINKARQAFSAQSRSSMNNTPTQPKNQAANSPFSTFSSTTSQASASSKAKNILNSLVRTSTAVSAPTASRALSAEKEKRPTTRGTEDGFAEEINDGMDPLTLTEQQIYKKELSLTSLPVLLTNINHFFDRFVFNSGKLSISSKNVLDNFQKYFTDITSAFLAFTKTISSSVPVSRFTWTPECLNTVLLETFPFLIFSDQEIQFGETHVSFLREKLFSFVLFNEIIHLMLHALKSKGLTLLKMFSKIKKIEEENWLLREILNSAKTDFNLKTIISNLGTQLKTHRDSQIQRFYFETKEKSTSFPETPRSTTFSDTYFISIATLPIPKGVLNDLVTIAVGTEVHKRKTVTNAKSAENEADSDYSNQKGCQTDPKDVNEYGAQCPEDMGETSPTLYLEHLQLQEKEYKEEALRYRTKHQEAKKKADDDLASIQMEKELELRQKTDQQHKVIYDLKKQLIAAKDIRDNGQADLDKLNDDFNATKNSLAEGTAKSIKMETEQSDRRNNIKTLEQEKANLEILVSKLTKDGEENVTKIFSNDSEKKQLYISLMSHKSELQQANAANKLSVDEIGRLKAEVSRFEREISLLVTFQDPSVGEEDNVKNPSMEDLNILANIEANRIRILRLESKNFELRTKRMENVRVGGRVDRFRANAINPVLLFDPLLLKDDSIRLGGKKKKESQDDFKEIIIAYKYNNPDRIIPPPMSCMGDDYLRSTIVDIISKPGKIQQRTHELDAARYSYYSKNLAGLPRNQVRMNFSAKQVQFEPDPFVEERKKTWNKNL